MSDWPWADLAAVWGFFALNVLSPGPNVFNTIGIALGSGRRSGLAAAAGVGSGVLFWGVAAMLGISTVFALWPGAQIALTLAGGALLLVFGSRYLRRAIGRRDDGVRARPGATPARAFAATLGVLATNPKALTTWLVILALFPTADVEPGARVALVFGMATVATTIHVGYALLFSTRRAAALYARAARAIDGGVGVFFISVGLRLIAFEMGLV